MGLWDHARSEKARQTRPDEAQNVDPVDSDEENRKRSDTIYMRQSPSRVIFLRELLSSVGSEPKWAS